MGCEATYSSVPPMPAPLAYFKFESPAQLDDSMGGITLQTTDLVDQVTGIIGNANAIINTSQTHQGYNFGSHAYPQNIIAGSPFTVRFWFKIITIHTGLNIEFYHPSFDAIIGTPDGNHIVLELWNLSTHFFDISSSPVIHDANWHRAVFIYDPINLRAGVKLDNNATEWAAAPAGAGPDAPGDHSVSFYLGPGGSFFFGWGAAAADEAGYWNVALTEDQLLADWNNGQGRTYP